MAHKAARIIFAILFIGTLFVFAGFNAYREFRPLAVVLNNTAPVSLLNLRQTISGVEQGINENLLGRMGFVETYAYIQVLLGKEESSNFLRAKGINGQWYFVDFYPQNTAITQNFARRIKALQNYVEPLGTKVLYINPPNPHIQNFSKVSSGLPILNYAYLQDALLYHLQNYGVDRIDLRTTLPRHEIPYDKWFFKTDHHWTSELAFAAFTDIVNYMDEKYSSNLDPDDYYKNPENYGTVTYPQSFLGSYGNHTGAAHSDFDDFTAMYPLFSGKYKVSSYDGKHSEGSIVGSIYYPSQLRISDIYANGMYAYYLQGTKAHKKIENDLAPEKPKLLIIGDSFLLPIASFLAPMFKQIDYVWPLDINGSIDIEQFIKDGTFDYIMIEAFEANTNKDEMFDYFRNADKTEADIIERTEDEK
jgi:hypothetical protein